MALKRQISPTCRYFETDGSPFECDTTQTCVTNGSYFGCSNFDIAYPFCMTGLKLLTRDTVSTLTGFLCANNRFRGSQYILENPIATTTSTTPAPTSPPPTGPSAIPTNTTSPVPSGPPVGAIVGGVVGGVALLGEIITAGIWMLVQKDKNNNGNNGSPDEMAPSVSQNFYHNGMGHAGAPMEGQFSGQTSGFDASKGNYQSTITPAWDGQSIRHHHGYSHRVPAPSIMSTSTAGPYQPRPSRPYRKAPRLPR
ncbi:hypothetical protein CSHISOI_10616, partial [Colletotrichum shisoi]